MSTTPLFIQSHQFVTNNNNNYNTCDASTGSPSSYFEQNNKNNNSTNMCLPLKIPFCSNSNGDLIDLEISPRRPKSMTIEEVEFKI